MSDKFEFTATHGVHLDDLDVHFKRDTSAEGAVYRYDTADAKQAQALQDVEGYGIKLVSEPEKPKAPTAAEKKAAKEAAEAEAAEKAAAEASEQK